MSKGTARRTVRIDDELWLAAKAKAEGEDTDISNVIRDLLRGYLADTEE